MRKSQHRPKISMRVAELARHLDCPFQGDGQVLIQGVSGLDNAKKGDLVFYSHKKYRPFFENTQASAAIVPLEEKSTHIPIIQAQDPHAAFIQAVKLFISPYRPEPGIHTLAQVSPSATIGDNVSIGAYVVVGDNVEIKDNTVIFPHVTIYPRVEIGKDCIVHSQVSLREDVSIGNRVILHNGVVIGSDGYGYIKSKNKQHIKIPQIGTVVIEDDVEIGANSTVDRAALGKTIIKKGTKIDNLVQIGHNVEIGENNIIIAQVGIGGSSKTGDNVLLAGQAGIPDHIEIGDDVIVAAKTGVTKNIPTGAMISGSPHLDIQVWRKAWAAIPKLYDLIREVRKLKKQVEELTKK